LRAAQRLEDNGWIVDVVQTEGGEHTTQLAREAAEESLDAIFVVGGDGSVGQAAGGLVGTQTALGMLPAGSSNVWARELGLRGLTLTNPLALEESALRLAAAPVYSVDVGICNDKAFLLWAGVGLGALVVHKMEEHRQGHRQLAIPMYVASVLQAAYNWEGIDLEVETDEEISHQHSLVAVVSNIRNYAGGLAQISPQACLDDGLMDLWLFSGDSLEQVVRHAFNLLLGRHVESSKVQHIPFRKLRIQSEALNHLQMDGESIAVNGAIEIEVQPRALRVLVPADAHPALFGYPAEPPLLDGAGSQP